MKHAILFYTVNSIKRHENSFQKGSLWCDSVEEAAGCLRGVFDKMPGLPVVPTVPAVYQ